MNLQEAKMFISNYEGFVEVFGEKILEKCLEKYELHSFSTFKYVIRDGGEDKYYARKGYPVLCDHTTGTFKEYKPGGWERDVKKPAREYRIPDSCQLKERDLLRDCIIMCFPYLADFNLNTYHLDRGMKSEFYIPTEDTHKIFGKKYLYCPVTAFLQSDYSIIENRTRSYLEEYYHGEDRKKFLDEEIKCLDSSVAQKLKEAMDCFKEKEGEKNEN